MAGTKTLTMIKPGAVNNRHIGAIFNIVITSYSIHYTKLYDLGGDVLFHGPVAGFKLIDR